MKIFLAVLVSSILFVCTGVFAACSRSADWVKSGNMYVCTGSQYNSPPFNAGNFYCKSSRSRGAIVAAQYCSGNWGAGKVPPISPKSCSTVYNRVPWCDVLVQYTCSKWNPNVPVPICP